MVATRLYFLKQLKRVNVPPKDMLLFYTTCIRPVLEYACPVFHHSLPQYLSNEMERLQKRALRIIQPDLSYAEALVALDITSLYERRKALSNALFDQIEGTKATSSMICCRYATGTLIAPVARDTSNYRFVRLIDYYCQCSLA